MTKVHDRSFDVFLKLHENHTNAVKHGFRKMELNTDDVGVLLELAVKHLQESDEMIFMEEAMKNWNDYISHHNKKGS